MKCVDCGRCVGGVCELHRRKQIIDFCRTIDGSTPAAQLDTAMRAIDGTLTACLYGLDFCAHAECEAATNEHRREAGKSSGGEVKRRPHVHRPVYFGTASEHNQKLLEGAERCLAQWLERNAGHRMIPTARNAHYLIELLRGADES